MTIPSDITTRLAKLETKSDTASLERDRLANQIAEARATQQNMRDLLIELKATFEAQAANAAADRASLRSTASDVTSCVHNMRDTVTALRTEIDVYFGNDRRSELIRAGMATGGGAGLTVVIVAVAKALWYL